MVVSQPFDSGIFLLDGISGVPGSHSEDAPIWAAAVVPPGFVLTKIPSYQSSGYAGPLARIIDRVVANARVIRWAPEAVALVGIVALGVSYFALQHFHRTRVDVLNDRIASQERLLADYRNKLQGVEEATAQIEKLTSSLTEMQKSLNDAKRKLASAEKRSRDPGRLYEDNNPIALAQDPKIDLDKRLITFPVVNAAIILGINKIYEFQDWRLACGGTQLYNMIDDGAAREFSYSPLTCRIVGNR